MAKWAYPGQRGQMVEPPDIAINADLLAPGSNVFSLRGHRGACACHCCFPECVSISYERSGHTQQLYRECPMERLTFPIVRAESPASERCVSPPPLRASFLSFFLGCESGGPLPVVERPPWQGV